MKTVMKIVGIILILFNSIGLLWGLLMLGMANSYGTQVSPRILIIYAIPLIIGIVLVVKSSESRERQEFEEYKRMKQQEQAMYYRYANAKGKPIEEYTMDDRTKVMVYYDRLPPKYQKKILDEVDRIYRQFENDLYTKK